MIRTFQVLLLIVIGLYLIKLLMLIFGYVTMWNAKASSYSSIKLTAVFFLGIAFTILIWISVLLFRFTQSAHKNNFFTVSNMRRLQTVGWLITGYGILSWLFTGSIPILIKTRFHYKSIINVLYSEFSVFPSWLITGMLLLLIAKAFEKGITLTEDNNSIV